MRPGTFIFEGEWMRVVQHLPETGMGYTVVTIRLRDGREFKQVVIDSGYLARVRGLTDVPFTETDIAEIIPTHDKWNWKETP